MRASRPQRPRPAFREYLGGRPRACQGHADDASAAHRPDLIYPRITHSTGARRRPTLSQPCGTPPSKSALSPSPQDGRLQWHRQPERRGQLPLRRRSRTPEVVCADVLTKYKHEVKGGARLFRIAEGPARLLRRRAPELKPTGRPRRADGRPCEGAVSAVGRRAGAHSRSGVRAKRHSVPARRDSPKGATRALSGAPATSPGSATTPR